MILSLGFVFERVICTKVLVTDIEDAVRSPLVVLFRLAGEKSISMQRAGSPSLKHTTPLKEPFIGYRAHVSSRDVPRVRTGGIHTFVHCGDTSDDNVQTPYGEGGGAERMIHKQRSGRWLHHALYSKMSVSM